MRHIWPGIKAAYRWKVFRWEFFWLCVILAATIGMHASIINQVQNTILDEVYYAGYYPELHGDLHYGDAYSILHEHVDARPEHPPLAKLIIAGGIKIFGDNYVGWRAPSILFGTIGIVLLFFICRKLGLSQRATNIATFLFALDNFSFMMASVAMLDVFFVTLMLASFLLYLYRRPVTDFFSGVFIGLSALAKLYGALGGPALFFHWLFSKGKKTWSFILTIVAALITFPGLIAVFDWVISGKWENPLSRIQNMLSMTGSLTFYNVEHPSLARPWSWILNYQPMPFNFDPDYMAALSPALWGAVIPLALYLIYRSIKQRNNAALFALSWFFSTYVLWIIASIVSNRVSFNFYLLPTVGALCLGLGMGLNEALEWVTAKRKWIKVPVITGVGLFLAFHLASFVTLAPVFFRSGGPFS
jgi:dolichyl-phosphate-mannose-protein mannosyltransferase